MQRVHDRVKETSTSTGTGNITLLGAVTQFQSFSNAFTIGEPLYYCIAGQSGVEWEVGRGYLSDATTLVREARTPMQAFESSNAGELVNFSAGTKDVFCTLPSTIITETWSTGRIVQLALGNAMP